MRRRDLLAALVAAPVAGPAVIKAIAAGPTPPTYQFVSPFATGGMVSPGVIALFGTEHGTEAFIPLSKCGRIPVNVDNNLVPGVDASRFDVKVRAVISDAIDSGRVPRPVFERWKREAIDHATS